MKPKINLEIKNRFLQLVSFFLFTCYSLASWSDIDPQKKITSCLIDIYTQQSVYLNKFERYSLNIDELLKKKNSSCRGVNLAILQATTEDFEISGEVGNSRWTVDSNKKFQKIR